jgi:quercetin dioxygenase-like cupin family protein
MHTQILATQPFTRQLRSGRVTLLPGESVGSHVAHEREEFIIVLSGEATVVSAGGPKRLAAGESLYIAPGTEHDIVNEGKKNAEYIYVVCMLG